VLANLSCGTTPGQTTGEFPPSALYEPLGRKLAGFYMSNLVISLAEARLIVLEAQGFGLLPQSERLQTTLLNETTSVLGGIQIDSVNVVVRSHYMPLFSRLGLYPMSWLDENTYRERLLFEYWGHEASLLPTSLYPLFRHRMEAARPNRRVAHLLQSEPHYVESILREIQDRGPLIVSQLNDPGKRTGPWWGYSNGKVALEWLFATGRVAVAGRQNFTRSYDLAERVIPSRFLNAPTPSPEAAVRELLRISAKALGVGTARDIADYYRIHPKDAEKPLSELEEGGQLVKVAVAGWKEAAFMHPSATGIVKGNTTALLSPFDSLIWKRDRTERLFGFRYRIEIYVPRAARQFGYYVLPFLMDGQLVARVDLKANRQESILMVQSAHIEKGQHPGLVIRELAPQLDTMARWLELSKVTVGTIGNLSSALHLAVRKTNP
jgi:uncharacterized protein YcaQ